MFGRYGSGWARGQAQRPLIRRRQASALTPAARQETKRRWSSEARLATNKASKAPPNKAVSLLVMTTAGMRSKRKELRHRWRPQSMAHHTAQSQGQLGQSITGPLARGWQRPEMVGASAALPWSPQRRTDRPRALHVGRLCVKGTQYCATLALIPLRSPF